MQKTDGFGLRALIGGWRLQQLSLASSDFEYAILAHFRPSGPGSLPSRGSHRLVKKKFSAQQMASVRQTLCDERFVELEDGFGPLVIHGGWSALTEIASEHINRSIRFGLSKARRRKPEWRRFVCAPVRTPK